MNGAPGQASRTERAGRHQERNVGRHQERSVHADETDSTDAGPSGRPLLPAIKGSESLKFSTTLTPSIWGPPDRGSRRGPPKLLGLASASSASSVITLVLDASRAHPCDEFYYGTCQGNRLTRRARRKATARARCTAQRSLHRTPKTLKAWMERHGAPVRDARPESAVLRVLRQAPRSPRRSVVPFPRCLRLATDAFPASRQVNSERLASVVPGAHIMRDVRFTRIS